MLQDKLSSFKGIIQKISLPPFNNKSICIVSGITVVAAGAACVVYYIFRPVPVIVVPLPTTVIEPLPTPVIDPPVIIPDPVHPVDEQGFWKKIYVFFRELNTRTLWIAAGFTACAAFIGYRIYSSSKQELKQKKVLNEYKFPDFKDYSAVQKYFIQEVKIGEQLIRQGDTENGLEHLCCAVIICGEPHDMIQIIKDRLSEENISAVAMRLPSSQMKMTYAMAKFRNKIQEEAPETES